MRLIDFQEDREIFFLTSLIVLLLLIAVTSILMIYGIKKHRFKFMYPTLFARVLLIIFVAVRLVYWAIIIIQGGPKKVAFCDLWDPVHKDFLHNRNFFTKSDVLQSCS